MDSFFGIGLFELVMIAVIALVVLGPERLPGAMREVAKYMKQLRNISHEFQSQFSEELKMLEEIDPRRILNEAIDPNAPANTTAAKPPAQVAPAAKSVAATSAATTAAAGAAAAAKPPAPAVKPAPPAVSPTVTNGEPANTILPPAKADPPADLPAEQPVEAPPGTLGAGDPTPAAAPEPPTVETILPVDVGLNGHQPSTPAGSNTEDQP
jgi:sec-independent protein translocase protein TatB